MDRISENQKGFFGFSALGQLSLIHSPTRSFGHSVLRISASAVPHSPSFSQLADVLSLVCLQAHMKSHCFGSPIT